ncbi:MAG: glutathione peroxidase [Hyphomicrobium sp.]
MKTFLKSAIAVATVLMAPASQAPAGEAQGSAFDFVFESIDGKPMPLAQWRGKALLVVNTASFCGYTKQYAGLQDLWSKYEDKGLVVIGVPSNDFGGQEPKAESEIKSFCQGAFGVTFPLTTKQAVTGANAHPFYQWASQAAGKGGEPGWNFHKYLIGRDGRLVRAFASGTTPMSGELTAFVDKALAEKVSAAAN